MERKREERSKWPWLFSNGTASDPFFKREREIPRKNTWKHHTHRNRKGKHATRLDYLKKTVKSKSPLGGRGFILARKWTKPTLRRKTDQQKYNKVPIALWENSLGTLENSLGGEFKVHSRGKGKNTSTWGIIYKNMVVRNSGHLHSTLGKFPK
jgi:hypothetical protein